MKNTKKLSVIQKRIIDKIRALHRAGAPLNITAVQRRDPKLLRQVMTLRYFRGWRKALEAAGLSYHDIKVELLDYCQCEICGEKMLVLHNHLWGKHGMSRYEYEKKFPDAPIMAEKLRAENTDALKKPPHWEPVWSREYLIDYFIYKHEQGEDLSPWVIYRNEPPVHANAKKYFGSYRAAIEAAGLDYRKVRSIDLTEKWTPEKVLVQIRKLHAQKPLQSTSDIRRRNSRLYDRCFHYFGSVIKALEAAGIPYIALRRRRVRKMTRQTVIQAIRTLGGDGAKLSKAQLKNRLDGQANHLLEAIDRYFSSWNEAIEAASSNGKRC